MFRASLFALSTITCFATLGNRIEILQMRQQQKDILEDQRKILRNQQEIFSKLNSMRC